MVLNGPYTYLSLKGVRTASEICLKCGVCCTVPEYGCPAQYDPKLNPKHTYVYDCLGAEKPESNPMIWQCVSCHKCQEMCPYEVNPVHFIEAMKQKALEAGEAPESITGEIEQVVNTGYAFPITANTGRLREELGLEPVQPTEELKKVAEATGLWRLLK
jgi:heterodisulfide reductase subunit C